MGGKGLPPLIGGLRRGDQAGRRILSELSESERDFNPGTIVGRFRIVRKIAAGGMGVVYEARDGDLGRPVALKHPRLDRDDPEKGRQRFLREARAASRLLHPNIVPIFEVFEAEGLPWMAMELVEGESLRERMKRPPPMSIPEALRHAEGLASALSEAHRMGVLHRDLKPANILLDARGRARLMDFGLAQPISSGDRETEETVTRLTVDGFLVGTPGYMSPEQALSRQVDARSDIFCLGLVIYEMCAGRPAMRQTESDSWLDNLLYTQAEPISLRRGDIPEELEDILNRAMAKAPEDRYQDAESMWEDLSRLRREFEAGLARRAFQGLRRRRRLLLGLSGATLVVMAAGAAWFGRGVLDPPESKSCWVAKPLTHDPSWAADPALSPDESLIAFASGRSGGDIWLIDREGGKALQLSHHPAADRRPAWSPDGSSVYFTSFRTGEPAIWKIPRLGGTSELVLPNADDAAISPDGATLAFVRRNESGHYRVAVAPLDHPESFRYLTTSKDGYWYHRHPRFSPDGKMISYNSSQGLWIVPAGGGSPHRLTSNLEEVGGAEWASDGRLFFPMSTSGTWSIWSIRAEGGPARRISSGLGLASQVSPSRDGRTLIYSTQEKRTTLEIHDNLQELRVSLHDPADADMPALAPDGSSIVFWAPLRDGQGLFIQDLEGARLLGKPRALMPGPGFYALPVFSPDGKWIAFQRGIDDQRDIWVVPREGGQALRFTEDPGADACPFFGPKGHFLYFSSDRVDRYHIWRAPFKNGKKAGDAEQLTFEASSDYLPKVSPDGSTLAWLANRNGEENLWVRSLDGPARPRSLTKDRRIRFQWWEPGSSSLLVSGDFRNEFLSLARVDLQGRVSILPRRLQVDFGQGDVGGQRFASGDFSLSVDGRLMVTTKTKMKGNIGVLKVYER